MSKSLSPLPVLTKVGKIRPHRRDISSRSGKTCALRATRPAACPENSNIGRWQTPPAEEQSLCPQWRASAAEAPAHLRSRKFPSALWPLLVAERAQSLLRKKGTRAVLSNI